MSATCPYCNAKTLHGLAEMFAALASSAGDVLDDLQSVATAIDGEEAQETKPQVFDRTFPVNCVLGKLTLEHASLAHTVDQLHALASRLKARV